MKIKRDIEFRIRDSDFSLHEFIWIARFNHPYSCRRRYCRTEFFDFKKYVVNFVI